VVDCSEKVGKLFGHRGSLDAFGDRP
jgi:hypothetical protein